MWLDSAAVVSSQFPLFTHVSFELVRCRTVFSEQKAKLRKPMCCPCPLQYEMYTIERNAERTASAGRLLYDMYVTRGGLSYQHVLRSFCIHCIKLCYRFVNFPDQPAVWREISVITAALRNDSQDKQTQFLRGKDFTPRIGRVQKEPKDKPSGFIASWASTKSIVW